MSSLPPFDPLIAAQTALKRANAGVASPARQGGASSDAFSPANGVGKAHGQAANGVHGAGRSYAGSVNAAKSTASGTAQGGQQGGEQLSGTGQREAPRGGEVARDRALPPGSLLNIVV